MTTALEVYGSSLDGSDSQPLLVRYADGRVRRLPVDLWTATEAPGDAGLLARCTGATLDVGCGPGRLVVALGSRGLPALGVDIAPAAVGLARSRGALVLARSIFAEVPGRGRWGTALLADGNVGIGGDPVGLLRRLRDLLSEDGQVLVEVDPPGCSSGPVDVCIEHAGVASAWFSWAHLSIDHADAVVEAAGLKVLETWQDAGRWFVRAVRT